MVKLDAHAVQCAHCGKRFQALRPEAVYCSGGCRVAAHRAKHAPPKAKASPATDKEISRLRALVERQQAEIERLRAQPKDAPGGHADQIIDAQRATLRESDRAKFDRAVARACKQVEAYTMKIFWAEVDKKVKERTAAEHARMVKAMDEADAQREHYTLLSKGVESFILTQDEFRLLQGCLHPDQPNRSAERLGKAFHVIRRFEPYIAAMAKGKILPRF